MKRTVANLDETYTKRIQVVSALGEMRVYELDCQAIIMVEVSFFQAGESATGTVSSLADRGERTTVIRYVEHRNRPLGPPPRSRRQ